MREEKRSENGKKIKLPISAHLSDKALKIKLPISAHLSP
jgi:hypothetical protein